MEQKTGTVDDTHRRTNSATAKERNEDYNIATLYQVIKNRICRENAIQLLACGTLPCGIQQQRERWEKSYIKLIHHTLTSKIPESEQNKACSYTHYHIKFLILLAHKNLFGGAIYNN